MKKLFFLLLCFTLLIACNNDDNHDVSYRMSGKWKLVTVIGFPGPPTDVSSKNIVYDFQSNGTLVVKGDFSNGMSGYFKEGSYKYYAKNDYIGVNANGVNDKTDFFQVDDTKVRYSYNSKDSKVYMAVHNQMADGSSEVFVKYEESNK